jgi:hypothetical protein
VFYCTWRNNQYSRVLETMFWKTVLFIDGIEAEFKMQQNWTKADLLIKFHFVNFLFTLIQHLWYSWLNIGLLQNKKKLPTKIHRCQQNHYFDVCLWHHLTLRWLLNDNFWRLKLFKAPLYSVTIAWTIYFASPFNTFWCVRQLLRDIRLLFQFCQHFQSLFVGGVGTICWRTFLGLDLWVNESESNLRAKWPNPRRKKKAA